MSNETPTYDVPPEVAASISKLPEYFQPMAGQAMERIHAAQRSLVETDRRMREQHEQRLAEISGSAK